MSRENFQKLYEAADSDAGLANRLRATKDFEELKVLAAEVGFDLGDLAENDAKELYAAMSSEGAREFSDEELDVVAGGAGAATWLSSRTTTPSVLGKGPIPFDAGRDK